MIRTVFSCMLLLAGTSISFAQAPMSEEPDYVADEGAAVRDGFSILNLTGHPETVADREIVDSKFASVVAESIDPGKPYGFSYAKIDLDGDGSKELVMAMKMATDSGGWGAPTFVYRYDGSEWIRWLADQAISIGVRPGTGPVSDIALIDPDGYRLFSFEGGRYVDTGKGPAR